MSKSDVASANEIIADYIFTEARRSVSIQANQVDAIGDVVRDWLHEEEILLLAHTKRRDRALEILQVVHEIILEPSLQSRSCPFCQAKSQDPVTLLDYVDELYQTPNIEGSGPVSPFPASLFTWFCPNCKLWECDFPPDRTTLNTRIWTKQNYLDNLKPSRAFAFQIFKKFPCAEVVAYEERGYSRGWVFRIGGVWYCNSNRKGQLEQLWDLQ